MTFREFVDAVAGAVGHRTAVVPVPQWLALALLSVVGYAVGEVILSREELQGLTTERLVSKEPPRGRNSVREWLRHHGSELGRAYVSELRRRR
jgi:hypothetical protein